MIDDYPHTAHLSSLSLIPTLSFQVRQFLANQRHTETAWQHIFYSIPDTMKKRTNKPRRLYTVDTKPFLSLSSFFSGEASCLACKQFNVHTQKNPLELQQSELFIPSNRAHTHNNLVYHDTRTRQQCIKSSSFLSSLPSRLCRFLSCSCFLLSTHDGGIASKFF